MCYAKWVFVSCLVDPLRHLSAVSCQNKRKLKKVQLMLTRKRREVLEVKTVYNSTQKRRETYTCSIRGKCVYPQPTSSYSAMQSDGLLEAGRHLTGFCRNTWGFFGGRSRIHYAEEGKGARKGSRTNPEDLLGFLKGLWRKGWYILKKGSLKLAKKNPAVFDISVPTLTFWRSLRLQTSAWNRLHLGIRLGTRFDCSLFCCLTPPPGYPRLMHLVAFIWI